MVTTAGSFEKNSATSPPPSAKKTPQHAMKPTASFERVLHRRVRLVEPPPAERLTDEHARRFGHRDAGEERHADDRERDLVRGDRVLADGAEDGGHRREREHLRAELEARGHAELGDLARRAAEGEGAARLLGARELSRAPLGAHEHHGHDRELEGLRRRGGPASAADTEGGEPEVTVDEAPREEGVEDVAGDADHHGRARVADRLPVLDERRERAGRRRAERHRGEEVPRERARSPRRCRARVRLR